MPLTVPDTTPVTDWDTAMASSLVLPGVKDSDQWCTGADLATALGTFHLDPCSNPRSHIQAAQTYDLLGRGQDGLTLPWKGLTFINPPYSAVLPWATRTVIHLDGFVMLVKLDPTTRWWSVAVNQVGVRWAPFRKRLKFERPDKAPLTANFPSALIWKGWTPSAELYKHWIWDEVRHGGPFAES